MNTELRMTANTVKTVDTVNTVGIDLTNFNLSLWEAFIIHHLRTADGRTVSKAVAS